MTFDSAMGISSGRFGHISENDGGPASLWNNWSSSWNRVPLEVTSGQSYESGSSNCFQQSENDIWRISSASYGSLGNFNRSTRALNPLSQQNLRSGFGTRRVFVDANPSLGVGRSAESIQWNSSRRIIFERQQESVPLNTSSTRNTRLSGVYVHDQLSRQVSYRESSGQRPSAAAASSFRGHQSRALSMHISDRLRTVHQWQMDPNLRFRNSSNFFIAGDTGTALQEESNIRNIPGNSTDHPMVGHAPELTDLTLDETDWSLGTENVNKLDRFASSTQAGPSSSVPPLNFLSPLPSPFIHIPPDSDPGGHEHEELLRAELAWRELTVTAEGRRRIIEEFNQVIGGERDEDDPQMHNGMAEIDERNEGMFLDVDGMSYEELLELGEHIGGVSTGLTERTILNRMIQRKYVLTYMEPAEDMEPCCICLESYTDGDDIGTLDCGHYFHTDCIKQWLMRKNVCPLCQKTALANKEKD